MSRSFAVLFLASVSLCLLASSRTRGQSPSGQIIYDNSLQSGWQNWSWASTNIANTSPVHGGSASISVTATAWQALFFHHDVQDSTPYASLSFWINGGSAGGQQLQVIALLRGKTQTAFSLDALKANTWQQVTIPLSTIDAAGQPDLDGFWIEDRTGTTQPVFYVDDVSLTPSTSAPPTSAHLTVNAAKTVRTIDRRMFGMNTAIWDFLLDTPDTVSLLGAVGSQTFRYPGGSIAEDFDWSTDRTNGQTFTWTGNPGLFANLITQTGADAYITVNYGSGTPQMAAAWVAWANATTANTTVIGVDSTGRDWKTAGYWASMRAAAPLAVEDGLNYLRQNHPAPYGFAHWEIGNEVYGTWETDLHGTTGSGLTGVAHDPTTYATAFKQFTVAMHAVDPSIKLGAVAIDGEDAYGTGLNPVPNPNENNALHSGWTPVVLATMAAESVTPDFLSYHRYPQHGTASDYVALFEAGTWQDDADHMRKMLTDYMGSAGDNVELDATETNTVADVAYKQMTSLVGGLYYADSFASALSTEFDADLWYTMHNGANDDTQSGLYGWRPYGDYGILASGDRTDTPANTPYPAYYGAKLCKLWADPGDTVLTSSTDYARLTVHAVTKANGHVTLLVVNKSPTSTLTGHIALTGYSTTGTASVHSYGKANDTAQTDVTASTVAISGSAFDYDFPSYSMTVIDLPFGRTVAKGLHFMSAPYDYTGTPLASLLGAGTKLYLWDPAAFTYLSTPTAPADTLHLGAGYWVKPAADVTLRVIGTPAPAGLPYKIALTQGWNMIGDPFTSPVAVGAIQVDTPVPSTPTPIASSQLVALPLYAYRGTSYVAKGATDTLDPYAGYWIYARAASTLIVPAP